MRIHAAIAALLLLGAWSASDTAPATDPLGFAAHGGVFGSDGAEVRQPTPGLVAAGLAFASERVLAAASPAVRAEFVDKRRFVAALAGAGGDTLAQLHAETLLLDWLVEETQPPDAQRWRQRSAMLKTLLQRLGAGTWSDHQRAMLAQAGLRAAVPAAAGPLPPPDFALAQQREAYLKQCVAAGVPRPPDWDPAGPAWTLTAEILASEVFIVRALNAKIYKHEATKPAGICLALPRYAPAPADADFQALGIICMGKGVPDGMGGKVTSACFWDNQVANVPTPIGSKVKVPIANFAAGEELKAGGGGICVKCHAGENSYIVHPDHAAFAPVLAALKADSYYTPLPRPAAGWPATTPNSKLGQGKNQSSCIDCHFAGDAGRLPEITTAIADDYCANVLMPALTGTRKTMPQGGDLKDYEADFKVLVRACAKPPAP